MRDERPRSGRLDRASASALLAPTKSDLEDARVRPPTGRDPGRPGREQLEPSEPPRPRPRAAPPEPEEMLEEPTAFEHRQVEQAVESLRLKR